MEKNWTDNDQALFESDLKDSIVADVAYFNSMPRYNDSTERENFDEVCDSFFEKF